MTRIRAPRVEDRGEWLRMRRALWPDCPDEEHAAEVDSILRTEREGRPTSGLGVGEVAVFVAKREGGGLCDFLEASIRPFAGGGRGRVSRLRRGLVRRSRHAATRGPPITGGGG